MTPGQFEGSVLLAGATGLVGGECLDLLLEDSTFSRVTALLRRPLPGREGGPRLHLPVVDFDHLEDWTPLFTAHHIMCALGTTIRKAGSQAAFRRVDIEYPLQIARLGLSRGARHFLLVSSMGANPHSRIFYNRVKGELEKEIAGLGYRSVTIVRPSFLLGERSEFRAGEEIVKRMGFLLPRTYRPVHARAVATALVQAARLDRPGVHILENRDLLPVPVQRQ